VQCAAPTPVTLLRFSGAWTPDGIVLEWETVTESNHAGFHVYRRGPTASWERRNARILGGGPAYRFVDPDVVPGSRSAYEVESVSRTGETERFGPVEVVVPVTTRFALRAAPNPAAGAARITYTLPEAGPLTLRVFDLSGRLVRVLRDGVEEAGPHGVDWDGRDATGRAVPSGIYFARVEAAAGAAAIRITILNR
jgi:hypothetical protein